jgi:hypothetical protein
LSNSSPSSVEPFSKAFIDSFSLKKIPNIPLFQTIVGVFLMWIVVANSGCRVSYSFTGASVSPDVKTVSILYFPNNAPLVAPTLSRSLTDAMRDYFTSHTNLNLVERNGDINVEGSITGYSVQPVAIQGNETAAMNRLTITISVKFTNRTNEQQNFETTFSRYLDYPSSKDLSSVQEDLIAQIDDQLIQDVFNKAVVNW